MRIHQIFQTTLILAIAFGGVGCVGTNVEDDDPNKIEALDYEALKEKRSPEIATNCNTDIMFSYGLSADANSLNDKNEVCPNIQQNCCGPKDQKIMEKLWKRNSKKLAIHYKTVLLIYKYILGYGKKYEDLANQVADAAAAAKEAGSAAPGGKGGEAKPSAPGKLTIRADLKCGAAAEKVRELGFGEREKVAFYYRLLSERAQFLHNTRRGFYCMICSVPGQKAIHNTPWLFQWLYSDRIYYNREFCKMLVDFSFRITYELAKTFNGHVKNLLYMTTCIEVPKGTAVATTDKTAPAPNNNAPAAQSNVMKLMLKNPLDLGDAFKLEMCDLATGSNFLVFEKCEYWCQQWSMTRPKSLFDGNARALKRIYDHLRTFEPLLKAPEQNLFRDDMTKLRNDIDNIIAAKSFVDRFFVAISGYQDLAKFKSDFVYSSKGVNPMELGKGCTLPFSYESATLFSFLAALVFFFLA